jgi:hypothetical protein
MGGNQDSSPAAELQDIFGDRSVATLVDRLATSN